MELPPSLEISPPITTVSTPTEEGDEVVMVGKQREVWAGSWELYRLVISWGVNALFHIPKLSIFPL
jgi:hypothetical protein